MSVRPKDKDVKPRPQNNSCGVGDPVYLQSGQFYYNCSDFSIPGRKLDVELGHTYFSGTSFPGPFGYGWFINYYMRLHKLRNGDAVIVTGDGMKNRYIFSGGTYTSPAGRYEALTQNANGTYTLTQAQGEKYQFDAGGKLAAIEDRNNNTITLAYSATQQPFTGFSQFSQSPTTRIQIGLDYRLETLTDTTGRIITFNYNPDGLLASIVEGTRQITFTYDPNTNDLLTVTKPATAQYPLGLTKTFTYDTGHNLETITDPKNQTFVTNHYNTAGRVEAQDLGAGSFQFVYTLTNNVVVRTDVTDRNTNVVRYDFNGTGNVVRKEEFTRGLRTTDPASFVTTYSYNADMEKTSVTLPRGNGVKYTYDSANPAARARGNLLEVRRKENMSVPDNNTNDIVTAVTYDTNFNQVKTLTDPRGNVTTYLYDYELLPSDPRYATRGNAVEITQPPINGQSPVTRIGYNTHGQPLLIQDPNGIFSSYAYYTATGYLQSVTLDPGGINAVTTYTYDNFGYPDLVTDAENRTFDQDHNELGWLIEERNPLNLRTKYSYDKNGNMEKVERQADYKAALWQMTNFTYDILNHLQTMTDPLNRVTVYGYDNNENRTSLTDAENHTTDYEYDERGLLFKARDANTPVRGVTQYDYDINGNLAKITDANAHATDYGYDLFDRRLTETFADTKFTEFEYDKNSNLTKVTQGKPTAPKVVQYGYDNLNNLASKTFPNNTPLNVIYGYDLGSRLLTANTTAANITMTYDNLNRVQTDSTILNSTFYTLNYLYDKTGNRTQVTYPSGKVADYVYDKNGRLYQVKVNGVVIDQHAYDPLDRRAYEIRYLSPSYKTQTGYQFDLGNQLKQIRHEGYTGNVLAQFDYPVYDKAGNRRILQVTRPGQSFYDKYGYNNIYELTKVTGSQSHTYQYDLVGNRTNVDGVAYTPNNVNQYTSVGTQAYGYDASGNLTSDGVNVYTYDEENRLTQVTNPGTLATYAYDGFNRRIAKTVNNVTTYYVQDEDREVEERNAAGILTADYVFGENIDEVLTMSRGGQTYFYYYDGLGSVTDLLSSTGAVVESYNYDVYGQPTVLSTVGNPFYFTGRRLDPESGKYYQRARTLDQHIGRFHQRDPIGYYDHMNLYQYAFNSPTNYIDPYGLWGVQFDNVNIGIGDPTFLFGEGSGSYFRQSLAATADGFIPFADPFSGSYNNCDKNLKISKAFGAVSRDVLVGAVINKGLLPGGWLNANRYFRIGFGQHRGKQVFRIAGEWVEKIFGKSHKDFWAGGRL